MARRSVWSWALYDWANSAFATTVIAGFFPVFFREYWSEGAEATVTTFRLGMTNGLASLLVALAAPVVGAIADGWGARKRLLLAFAGLGIVMTGGLYFVQQGQWPLAALLYVMAWAGFAGSNVFYDALLVQIAPDSDLDRISSLGFALGYLGGGLLFAVNVLMTLNPTWFGLPDAAVAVRLSFISVAVWWGVFTLPLLLFVHDERRAERSFFQAVEVGIGQLLATFRQVRRLKPLALFLIAYFFYIDGVNTIVKMALDFGMSLGFQSSDLIAALLLVQFVGFPAALGFGRLARARWIGPKWGVMIGLGGYVLATVWAATIDSVAGFYGIAVLVGLVQGGVQALSRSLYARMVPTGQAAEFFGFYNMLGRFAAVLGPFLVGW
ncbi:MAG: MFS transporter, partial [Planctomycetales bacterium]|nr:MFS transporter [Planctomycetales bacterium]